MPTIPPPPVYGDRIGTFLFNDTNLVDGSGSPPLTASNLALVSSWESNALEVASSEPVLLRYAEFQTNGVPNLRCDVGTVLFSFQPYWSSTNAGGSGPGTWAPFVEVGTYTEDASGYWWSLFLDPAGCILSFAVQSNGAEGNEHGEWNL